MTFQRTDDKLSTAAHIHTELRERIKTAYDLTDDDQTLADTLEGESDFAEMCFAAIRQARERQSMAKALGDIISDMRDRKARLETSADAIRFAVADAMQKAGEPKLTAPDFTLSSRMGKPAIVIPDNDAVPHTYCKQIIKFVPDKEKIKDAMDAGENVNFASIWEPQPILTVRSK